MLACCQLSCGPQLRYGPTGNYLARPQARSPFGFRAQHQKVQQVHLGPPVGNWVLSSALSQARGTQGCGLQVALQSVTQSPCKQFNGQLLELTILVLCVVLPLRLCPTAINMRCYRSWSSRWNAGHGDKCKPCCINSHATHKPKVFARSCLKPA